mmetsp:Transcript_10837/g.43677  ORF Transcript_10837/g.43677 Transcript_10837/m.43677 type:complete len:206 (-) Transcript_10837:768-1385(-)
MVPRRRLPPHVRRGGQHVPRVRYPRQPRRRTTRVRRADRPTRPPRGPALAGVEDQGEGIGVRLRVVPRDVRERPGDVRLRLHGQGAARAPVGRGDGRVAGVLRGAQSPRRANRGALRRVRFGRDEAPRRVQERDPGLGRLQARAGLRRVPDAGTQAARAGRGRGRARRAGGPGVVHSDGAGENQRVVRGGILRRTRRGRVPRAHR